MVGRGENPLRKLGVHREYFSPNSKSSFYPIDYLVEQLSMFPVGRQFTMETFFLAFMLTYQRFGVSSSWYRTQWEGSAETGQGSLSLSASAGGAR
jgi:hypothetical protein